MITDGRAGEEAIITWQVDNGPWPEVNPQDNEFFNTVLLQIYN